MKNIALIAIICLGFSTMADAQKTKKIPYKVANRYFVNNSVKDGLQAFPKITSEEEFNKLFGMAAVMGKNGTPTNIDFSKQYVIAIIDEITNKSVKLTAESLTQNKENITFTYEKQEGKDAGSAYFRHCLIIIVDKKYDGNVTIKNTDNEEIIPYIPGHRFFVNNTVEEGLLLKTKITSQEEFDKYFGLAAVMGEGGLPTHIDFSRQYVIAVINPSADNIAETTVNNLTKKDGIITLTYTTDNLEPGDSYRTCFLVVVDNQYTGEVQIISGK